MQDKYAGKIMISAGEYLTAISAKSLTPIYKMHYVSTFEDWDDSITVFIFFIDEKFKEQAIDLGIVDMLKDKYIAYLKTNKYPFEKFPKVHFEIDSHENVVKNFKGSYFYRLR